MRAVVDAQVVGDGLLPEKTMGPMNNAKQMKVVTGMIAEARAHRQDVLELGQVPGPYLHAQGDFQRPSLVIGADPSLSVVREEQFGPILPITPFESEEQEALVMANDDQFGLASSVWSRDAGRAVALARRIEAGYAFINTHGPSAQDGNGPFGGFRKSGIGRNFGDEGVTQFQGYHSIAGTPGMLV